MSKEGARLWKRKQVLEYTIEKKEKDIVTVWVYFRFIRKGIFKFFKSLVYKYPQKLLAKGQ